MTRLAAFQDEMLEAIGGGALGDPRPPAFLAPLARVPLARGLSIYRTNVSSALLMAMEETYPKIRKLLGPKHFSSLCRLYQGAAPQAGRDLNAYGADFADILAATDLVETHPPLPDLARLEWTLHQAFYAADDEPASERDVAEVIVQGAGGARLSLRASARLVSSRWPVAEMFEKIERGARLGSEEAEAVERNETLLVFKDRFLVRISAVEPGLHDLVSGLARGAALDAIAHAYDRLGAPRLFGHGLIVAAARRWLKVERSWTPAPRNHARLEEEIRRWHGETCEERAPLVEAGERAHDRAAVGAGFAGEVLLSERRLDQGPGRSFDAEDSGVSEQDRGDAFDHRTLEADALRRAQRIVPAREVAIMLEADRALALEDREVSFHSHPDESTWNQRLDVGGVGAPLERSDVTEDARRPQEVNRELRSRARVAVEDAAGSLQE
jgi:hypothetical protein